MGLSLQTNQSLLRGLLTQTGSSSETNQETVKHIKKILSKNLSAERSINLFHCLNELNDRSLVNEIQWYLSSGSLSTDKLSPAQWSALGFILLSTGKDLDVFDLKKYSASEETLLRLMPVVKASNKSKPCWFYMLCFRLSGCNLTNRSCEALSSVLSSQSSQMSELDLSNNDLKDSGVKILCSGLNSQNCKLETLRLSGCLITEEGCSYLASALKSNPTHLRELDLQYNHPGEGGVQLLSTLREHPQCRLDTLSLSDCILSKQSCRALSSVLSSESCSLKELDMSKNNLTDSGVKMLSDGLKSSHCRLETLRSGMSYFDCLNNLSLRCGFTFHLFSTVKHLHDLPAHTFKIILPPNFSRLSCCLITAEGCASLASALTSNPSHLKELDLSCNYPGDSGVQRLSIHLEDPRCRLNCLKYGTK
uniref:NACHT LRR and PYD domain-containing protein n=1 Tax=Sphaeramia orbicularis TaxID=375764 RepID=A0A673CAJ5_9TELE